MKRVYFVRHGETVANQHKTLQDLTNPLTLEGERQALRVAERAVSLTIDFCVASDALRTRQTASSIADQIGKEFEYSPLFREWPVPSSFVGLPEDGEVYREYIQQRNAESTAWKLEDEESFEDRIVRVRNAMRFLENKDANDILVVTHGMFLKFLIGTVLIGQDMTREIWRAMSWNLTTTNTGITVCLVDGDRWRLLTWNDHAHFGDEVFRL